MSTEEQTTDVWKWQNSRIGGNGNDRYWAEGFPTSLYRNDDEYMDQYKVARWTFLWHGVEVSIPDTCTTMDERGAWCIAYRELT